MSFRYNCFNSRLFEELGSETVMLLGESDHILGLPAVADAIREDSRDVVQELHKAGMKHVTMKWHAPDAAGMSTNSHSTR